MGRRGSAPEPVTHGTYGGYQVHNKRGEEPCGACRRANAAYNRAYRQRQNAGKCAPGLGWPMEARRG